MTVSRWGAKFDAAELKSKSHLLSPSVQDAFSGLPGHGRTGYVYDPRLLAHENYISEHPEQPDRIQVIHEAVANSGLLQRIVHVPLRLAKNAEIELVHDKDYIQWMDSTALKEPTEYERESVYYNRSTAKCARLACGGTLELASHIAKGKLQNGIAIIRPPGHHAECAKAMGFCFLNHVAIAAKYLQTTCGLQRILILDWDIHHGNGTQSTFLHDSTVLYISLHRYEHGSFFPGEKDADFTVVGGSSPRPPLASSPAALDAHGHSTASAERHPASGKNVNIPWSDVEMGDAEYLHAFMKVVLPIAYEFAPDFVLVSAGFDAAQGDPIGEYHVTPKCYGHLTHLLMGLAGGKILLVLEGGYSLTALPQCAVSCLHSLLGDPPALLQSATPHATAVYIVDRVREIQSQYWTCFGSGGSQATSVARFLLGSSVVGSSEEAMLATMARLTTGLRDVFRVYWSSLMMDQYQLIRMPMLDASNSALDGDVFVSPNLLFTRQPILVLFHDAGLFHRSTALPSDTYLCNSDAICSPCLFILEKAFEKSYTVIDACCAGPSRKKMIDSEGHEVSKSDVAREHAGLYLWDQFLSLGMSSQIILVGVGESADMITSLVSQRELKESVRLCISFPASGLPKPVPTAKASWYYEHSINLIPSPEPAHTDVPFSRAFGRCVSSGYAHASSHAGPLFANMDYIFKKMERKLQSPCAN